MNTSELRLMYALVYDVFFTNVLHLSLSLSTFRIDEQQQVVDDGKDW